MGTYLPALYSCTHVESTLAAIVLSVSLAGVFHVALSHCRLSESLAALSLANSGCLNPQAGEYEALASVLLLGLYKDNI